MEISATEFDWTDYVGFVFIFLISTVIGIYFGCFGSKQKTTDEYLHGGRQMNTLVVALSLVATNIAGMTLMTVPAEVYTHNAMYLFYCPAMLISMIFSSYFFIPVFFHLDISNSYEYLELRFSKNTKSLASAIYVLSSLLYLPFTIYVPALAFNQVTGLNIYIISSGVAAVCIFYTAIGGLKAFVWSDFIQTVILILVTLFIIIVGTINADGPTHVVTVASKGRLLDILDFNPNPFIRNTFWATTIGSIADTFIMLVAQQDSIQRLKSVPSMKKVNIILVIYWIGVTGVMLLSIYSGILVYSIYFGCDPIERDIVEEPDQIFPYYILNKLGYIPALPGLFVAGIFCGGLSSMAAILNTLGGSIYSDYIKRENHSQRFEYICMRAIVIILGIYAVAAIPILERMGSILSALYLVDSITGAPCLSFFVLGMLTPWCNSRGAITGAITSMLFLTWLTIGSSLSGVNLPTEEIYPGIPNTCNLTFGEIVFNFTSKNDKALAEANKDTFFMYNLSFMYFSTFGAIINISVALTVSYFTGGTNLKELNPNLISPPMRRFLPKQTSEDVDTQNGFEMQTKENGPSTVIS